MRFSERYGNKSPRDVIQVGSMDERLRTSLWNMMSFTCLQTIDYQLRQPEDRLLLHKMWDFLGWNVDTIPRYDRDRAIRHLRQHYEQADWDEAYDFVEAIVNLFATDDDELQDLSDSFNDVLTREMAGYRFIQGLLTPITSSEELEAIERAMSSTSRHASVQAHLQRALELLSDRDNADYRNSIKESISAVEAMCRVITGDKKATLGQALGVLETQGSLHPALRKGFASLYGYTSDADGIRHALADTPTLGLDDAVFLLVSCAAFINYLLSKTATTVPAR